MKFISESLNDGFALSTIGLLPTIKNLYYRSYYMGRNCIRVTIDTNLTSQYLVDSIG